MENIILGWYVWKCCVPSLSMLWLIFKNLFMTYIGTLLRRLGNERVWGKGRVRSFGKDNCWVCNSSPTLSSQRAALALVCTYHHTQCYTHNHQQCLAFLKIIFVWYGLQKFLIKHATKLPISLHWSWSLWQCFTLIFWRASPPSDFWLQSWVQPPGATSTGYKRWRERLIKSRAHLILVESPYLTLIFILDPYFKGQSRDHFLILAE